MRVMLGMGIEEVLAIVCCGVTQGFSVDLRARKAGF